VTIIDPGNSLERSEAEQEARIMLDRFMERHVKLEVFLLKRFEEVRATSSLIDRSTIGRSC
jgi:hypothetical protein